MLSVQFHFSKIAHFHFQPFQGRVEPEKVQIVSVVFAPNQLGLLSDQSKLSIFGITSKVLQTCLLNVIGNATISEESANQEGILKFVEIGRLFSNKGNHEYPRLDHEDGKLIYPQLLDFGTMCLKTISSKVLKIKNCQNRPVLVQLHSHNYQVEIKDDTSRVISPHGTHGFEISVSPKLPGVFQGLLNLQVDGAPFNCINVKAQAELPYLEIYPNKITLKPQRGSTCLISVDGLREFVCLKNHLNMPVHFRWTSNSQWESLKINPEIGIVSPNNCQNCEITYRYSFNEGRIAGGKATFCLSAFLGSPVHLEGVKTEVDVLLHLPSPKLTSTSKRIKLGDVPYGLEIVRTFRLRNIGGGPAFVEFRAPSVVDDVNLNVDPSRVEIRSQEGETFKVTCCSRKTGYFEIPISILHVSKEVMQTTAQGMCIFPKIEICPFRLGFKCGHGDNEVLGTPIGEKSKTSFAVKNVSPVPASIEFDLSNCKDFSVDQGNPGLLKPFSSRNYELIFKPDKVSNFDLMLPLIVNGKRITSDACRVTATSIRGLVNVSPRVISVELSPSIVESPEIIQKEFQIESCANQVIQWQIDTSNLPSAISIECDGCNDDNLCGTLRELNASVKFIITLTLDQLNFHPLEVPIIVEDDCNQSQMSFVTILIKNVEVKLACHPSHVILPPIPLSTRVDIDLRLTIDSAEYNFQLENIGFATWNEKLQKKCPFSVVLPQGKAFRSKSISQEMVVRLQIESSHFFVISNRPQPPCLLFIAESLKGGRKLHLYACVPFVFSTDDSSFSLVHFNSLPKASGESLMAYQRELDSGTSHVIERWLRHYGFPGGIRGLNFPIDFQRCLSLHYIQLQEQPQKSNQIVHSLDVLVECLAHMAASWSLPGVPRSLTLPTDDTATCIGALYNHHAALVCFVESQGGCVGHIMPEYLMTYNDYLDWIRNGRPCGYDDLFYVDIPTKAALDGVSPTPTVILGNANGNVCLRCPLTPTLDEEAFDKTSRIAWVDLFLQLLKTLEIGKGTEAKLLQWIKRSLVHGWTQLCEANTQFNTSTWIHLPRPRIKNFQEDLASGLALAAVIADQASFMKEEVLSEVNLDPKDPQLRFHNAVQVVKALELMRMDADLTPVDIFHPNVLHMTLVLSRLYRLLPEYKIKSTILFKGKLQTCVMEDLNLTNPTNQLLRYQCFFIGRKAESFKFRGAANDIRTMELELTPNSASTLTLSFTVSSLHQCEAYLLLVSQRGYIPRGSTMVFRLIGKATGLKSEEVFNFKTTCYQAVIGSIPIRNPFNAAGHFNLRVMESPPYCPDMSPGRLRGFSCRLSEVFLHVERVTSVEVAFHPFSVGKYRGQLVLSNQDLGDFAIELRGCSTAFKTTSSVNKDEIFKLRCPVNMEHCVNLQLPCKNLARYSAMEWVAEYCLSPLEMERIKISGELCNVVSKLLLFKDSDPLDTKKTRFQIKCDSSIVELPRFLDVDLGKSERSSRYVDLPLRIFCPKKEIHHINIILSAADDLRCFIVECEALEDNTADSTADVLNYRKDMSMERFLADPTVFITEELEKLHPLTNRKDRGLCFYAGRIEIKCQVGDCTHKVDQSDKHDISLFLPKNKSSRTQLFRVESDFPTDILVSDAHVISRPNCRGRCRIVIPIKRRAYTFGKLLFREDSMDSRRIQQSDEPEIRLLYEVNIRIKPAPPIQRLEVICHCLKVNQIIIPLNLSTPLPSDDQHLQVTLEGDDLTGPNITEDVSIYTAEYRPTCVGKVKASAIFYNSNLSEFWVELTLVAKPPLPQIVSPWRCELGRQCIGVVEIANPSRKSYHLSVERVNDRVYAIDSYSLQKEGEMVPLEGANVPLPALSTLYLSVTFRPQEYGHCLNDGEIVLRSEELGELRVQLHGEGSLPTWNSEVCVTSEAGKSQLFSIFFTNPFPYPIDTRCALEAVNSVFDQEMEKASNAFETRGERHLNLLGNQRKEFHLRFTPSLMHVYRARFEIVARKANLHDGGGWETREIAWSTPLRGTPTLRGTLELPPKDLLQELVHPRKQPKSVHPLLKVKAGTSTPIKLHLNLAGFVKDPDEDMVFNWRFVVDSCHEDTLVDADTVLREAVLLEQTKCDFADPSDNVPHLELSGVFRPSRSFKIDASLCVTSKAGGMWVFPVHLEATLTQKVERRLIFSPQGLWKSDYKKLRLDSREETPAKFRAFLVKTGAGLFSINKTSGLLPAKDAGIFTLIVKFTRKSYGREVMDRLVIQTPTMEWMYELSAEAIS
ncbi:Cilia- and flagella-associated protein 47 [Echinococcus granulosus]|nr:Cilia- and flagella-associated protein 47 [Echinococcus granulosus]